VAEGEYRLCLVFTSMACAEQEEKEQEAWILVTQGKDGDKEMRR